MEDARLAPILNSRDAGAKEIEALKRFTAPTPVMTLNVHFPETAMAPMIPVASSGE
jgi:hypothetical protein